MPKVLQQTLERLEEEKKYEVVKQALSLGFSGIGVAGTFVHVDDRCAHDSSAIPVIWTY